MRDHRPLRRAGGAGGVNQHGNVVGSRPFDLSPEAIGVRVVRPAADVAELVQEQDPVVGEVVEPVPFEHDALRHPRNPVADLEKLVELLVVLHDEKPALRVLQEVSDLLGAVGRVDPRDDSTDALDAEIGVYPLLVVLGDDGDHFTPLEAQLREPQADRARGLQVRRPRMALPDPELLLAVCGPLAERPAAEQEQLHQRIAAVDQERGAGRTASRPRAVRGRGSGSGPRSDRGLGLRDARGHGLLPMLVHPPSPWTRRRVPILTDESRSQRGFRNETHEASNATKRPCFGQEWEASNMSRRSEAPPR